MENKGVKSVTQAEEEFKASLLHFLEDTLQIKEKIHTDKVMDKFFELQHKAVHKTNLDDLNDVARDFLVDK